MHNKEAVSLRFGVTSVALLIVLAFTIGWIALFLYVHERICRSSFQSVKMDAKTVSSIMTAALIAHASAPVFGHSGRIGAQHMILSANAQRSQRSRC